MLSISKPLNAERAVWYFESDNYYLEQSGVWYGNIREALSLDGPIRREDFLKLLAGFNTDGSKLVASAGAKDIKDENGNITKHGHRSGVDLTFSAPKSVSILSYHDSRINDAFKKALHSTLDHVEKEFSYTQTKIRPGVVFAEKTGKTLFGTFLHDTSRELDPQLHCHCVLMNLTQDSEGTFKTFHNDAIYKNKMLLGQFFRNQLAKEVQEIGYSVSISDRKQGFFEIAGVEEDIIKAFSKRSVQVREEMKCLRKLEFKDLSQNHLHEWAKERKKSFFGMPEYDREVAAELEKLSSSTDKVYMNFSDAELAAFATTNSRVAKKDVSREYVTSIIEQTCKNYGTSLNDIQIKAAEYRKVLPSSASASDILQDAIKGITENESTFSKEKLIYEAMKMGIGIHSYEEYKNELCKMIENSSISLLAILDSKSGSKEIYSSAEMIEIENSVIQSCVEAKGSSSIYIDSAAVDRYVKQTDKILKMKSVLQLSEKDPEKANVEFQALLLKITDPIIREKLSNAQKKMLSEGMEKHAHEYAALSEYFEKHGHGFTEGQKDALKLIASTKDQFSVIQGDAGTGKSFSVLYAKQLLESNGFIVKGFAPTGKATTGLASSAEISVENYSTIDSFLLQFKNADPEKRKEMYVQDKEVWVIDEAGMCGSRKFRDLLDVAKECGAKMIFIGDRKQFQSIEAGRMFSDLQDRSGIDIVIMPDVIRQKTDQTKEIVKAISLKDMDFAFNVMQGFKKISGNIDKGDCKNYTIGSTIYFKNGYLNVSSDTSCKIVRVGESNLTLEYFDDQSRVYKKIDFEPSSLKSEDFDIFKPPVDNNFFGRYDIHDSIQLTVSEQGLPSNTQLIVKEVSESILMVSYKDSTGTEAVKEFDPRKNPDNVCHLSFSGNEKRLTGKDTYENMITVEADHEKCLNLTAQDYLDSLLSKKKEQSLELPFQDVLLITGTNKEKNALNNIIRPELLKKGFISDSKVCTVFQTKSLSGTGAMAADSYSVGQVIITNKKCGIIPKGTQCDIIGVNLTDNCLRVRFWDREEMNFVSTTVNVRKECKKFSTYDQEKKEFGVGDLILFLKNDKRVVGVNNGDTARILSIDENGNVKARIESSEHKKEVSFNINNKGPGAYNFVSHAYAITDYKSQGATTERLLWFAPTKSGKMSSNTFYVAITRCKKEVGVYTDNVDDLREMVKKEQQKESVLDYPKPKLVQVETDKECSQNNVPEYKNPFSFEKAVKSVQDFYKEYVASIFTPKEDMNIERDKEKISIKNL